MIPELLRRLAILEARVEQYLAKLRDHERRIKILEDTLRRLTGQS